MRPHTGFTLVEVLVALVLFEFAMLALSAVSATAARDLAAARVLERAGSVARNRVEQLSGGGCPPARAADTSLSGGLREHWRVEAAGPTRRISDSVTFAHPRGGTGFVIARAATVCAP